ncbi:MAG: 50S ribosomal protein L9 [Fibrobacterota bacterium]
MDVILQKDVAGLGKAFELVKVKDGYAHNYLIPNKLAYPATEGKKQRLVLDKKNYERKEASHLKEAEALAQKLSEVSVTITVKVDEADHLYGSVTTQLIAEKLAAEGYTVNKKDIRIEEPIKALGVYNVKVHVHAELTAAVKVWVVKEGTADEEAVVPAPAENV